MVGYIQRGNLEDRYSMVQKTGGQVMLHLHWEEGYSEENLVNGAGKIVGGGGEIGDRITVEYGN